VASFTVLSGNAPSFAKFTLPGMASKFLTPSKLFVKMAAKSSIQPINDVAPIMGVIAKLQPILSMYDTSAIAATKSHPEAFAYGPAKGSEEVFTVQPLVLLDPPVSAAQSPSVSVPLPVSETVSTPAILSQPTVDMPVVSTEVTKMTAASMFNVKMLPMALIIGAVIALIYKFGKKHKYGGKR
jgi:hypothetical protein